jgi:2-amino-4-hydroxy-6-hydroxymethyldihydropteridine diphosphokinase
MSLCLIGLGSNEGDRQATLFRALDELGRHPGIRVLRRSRLVETVPIGGPPNQGRYLNAAAVLETALEPDALLAVLLQLEVALGRRRAAPWGPRTIDLDLLLYEDVVCTTPSLILPHPRMAWRRFVIEPAADVAGQMVHPTIGWTVSRLREHLSTAKNYLAVTGLARTGKTDLVRQIVHFAKAHLIAESIDSAATDAFYANSAGNAEAAELELASRRARLLAAGSAVWQEPATLWGSDFWFDQSLAFARVRMPADQWTAFQTRWEEAAREVERPKLVVMLDAGTDWLLERLGNLGQAAGLRWTREALDQLREALDWCLRRPEVGPVLRLVDQPPEQVLREVLAAAEAMRS